MSLDDEAGECFEVCDEEETEEEREWGDLAEAL